MSLYERRDESKRRETGQLGKGGNGKEGKEKTREGQKKRYIRDKHH